MDSTGNGSGTLQLSEDARKLIEAAEARAQAAESKAENLEEKVESLTDDRREGRVKTFLDELRAMDLDEKHGQSGFLNEVSLVLSADDDEPAVVSEAFSEDGKSEVSLTLTEAFRRVFKALKKGEDGKLALAEQLEQASSSSEAAGGEKPDGGDGKPPKDEGGEDDLSVEGAEKRAAEWLEENPGLARVAPLVTKQDGGES